MIRRLVVATLAVACAVPAQAQIGRRQGGFGLDPNYWVGVSYGYVSGVTITDQASSTVWQFGYTSQIRATIEKTMQRGFAIGAAAGYTTAPLTYTSTTFTADCPGSCQANADITQYMAFIHGGSGAGFHGLYSVEAGVTQFSKFRTRDTNVALAPTESKSDFSFGFGGGVGYGFSQTSEAYVAEQWDLVLHPQGSQTNQSAPRIQTLRAGFRVGF